MAQSELVHELDGLVERMSGRVVSLRLSTADQKGFLAAQVLRAVLEEVKDWKFELEKVIEGYKHELV